MIIYRDTNDILHKTVKNQCSEEILKANIFQQIIVRIEKNLTKDFINEYILNPKYSAISKDQDITYEILKIH